LDKSSLSALSAAFRLDRVSPYQTIQTKIRAIRVIRGYQKIGFRKWDGEIPTTGQLFSDLI
jgi:hypothetical protein